MDAVVTTAVALRDPKGLGRLGIGNTRHGAVHLVELRMSGPAEAAFVRALVFGGKKRSAGYTGSLPHALRRKIRAVQP